MTLKIYTKVGDQGKNKQVSGKMVPKYDLQIETLGNLDELQSYLGVTIANLSDNCQVLKDELQKRQKELYQFQADIVVRRHQEITPDKVKELESRIDKITQQYPRIPAFILPGGSITAANLQYSRTLARRAERSLVELNDKKQPISPFNLEYINRLSDYLFTLARYANVLDGYQEVKSK